MSSRTRFDERELAVARLYAGSALGLASDPEALLEELAGIGELLDRNPDVEAALASPLVDAAARRSLVETAFRGRLDDVLVNTFQVMNRKGRLGLLRAFIEGFRLELEAAQGLTEVEVVTATGLSDAQRRRTEEVAASWVGGKVRLLEEVDETVLGGMMLKAGDRKLDRTVARELETVGERLFERASQKVQELAARAADA